MVNAQPLEAMLELVRERGDAISRDDLRELDWLTTKLPLEDAFEQRGWVDEAITLIITDPSYTGDITSDDLA
jgi:hypothetical protein